MFKINYISFSIVSFALEYYERKYGNDIRSAFIHLVREVGQIAYALETDNNPVASAKITEAAALLRFIAARYQLDLEKAMETMYSKKLSSLNKTR